MSTLQQAEETWVDQGKYGESSTYEDGTSQGWMDDILLLMIII